MTNTLTDYLNHPDETIRRHAKGIEKRLQAPSHYTETADGHHLAPLCRYCVNTAKVECKSGHIYCPTCEMDTCDIPL